MELQAGPSRSRTATVDGEGHPHCRGGETAAEAPEPNRYIYYRLYTADGPIEANTAIYSNADSLGRVSAKSILRPHTVDLFLHCVMKVEGFSGVEKTELFESASSRFAMDRSTSLSIARNSGPGLSEYEPMALVIDSPIVNRVRNLLVLRSEMTELVEPLDEPYVYYRVYNEDGEVKSNQHFHTTDNSLGRISIASITPPHTIASLKNRLARAELVDKTRVAALTLFKDITRQVQIKEADDEFLSTDVLTEWSESRPMALVHPPRVASRPTEPAPDPEKGKTVMQARALYDFQASPDDPNELSFKKGDIFDIIDSSSKWWDVKKADGSTGSIPSNFVRRCNRSQVARCQAKALYNYQASPNELEEVSFTKGEVIDVLDDSGDWWEVRKACGAVGDAPSNFLQKMVWAGLRAEALYDYQAADDDPKELSFREGDMFEVLNNLGKWWEVRKVDGTTGNAPSDCLRIVPET